MGRFLTALGEGTGGLTVHRSSTANFQTLVNSPLTVLAVVGLLLVWFALLQPWGGLMRLFGIYPAIRAALAGTAVAAVIAGLLGGSALDVAGAAAALVVPMAALASLRVLDHSTDRTLPDPGHPRPEGPAGPPGGAPSDGTPPGGRPDDGGDPVGDGDDPTPEHAPPPVASDGDPAAGPGGDGARPAGRGGATVPAARVPGPAAPASTEVVAGRPGAGPG